MSQSNTTTSVSTSGATAGSFVTLDPQGQKQGDISSDEREVELSLYSARLELQALQEMQRALEVLKRENEGHEVGDEDVKT